MFDSLLSLRAIPRDQVLELNLEDLVVNNRRESYSRLLDFVGIEDNQSMHEYFDKEMPSERLRIGKYRDEIPDWQELDKAYLASSERLKPLLY
ncbi:MAG: hypothetical protein FJW51_05805 [Actinobacteria bacterium]|nr:hypothetical protein [Actinomycetota bacterium]MBM3743995.1 hypothetical protein [Actinomycetota bacterium]